jgi:hypothetical protein
MSGPNGRPGRPHEDVPPLKNQHFRDPAFDAVQYNDNSSPPSQYNFNVSGEHAAVQGSGALNYRAPGDHRPVMNIYSQHPDPQQLRYGPTMMLNQYGDHVHNNFGNPCPYNGRANPNVAAYHRHDPMTSPIKYNAVYDQAIMAADAAVLDAYQGLPTPDVA